MSEETKTNQTTCGDCLCQGAGPAFTEFLRRLGPPPEAKRHFDTARVEFLKGLRSLIDQRISDINRTESKGASITVE
ncbi:MAG: hypothetical protein KJZ84_08770 [Bryobacteraceae bacterium]|nr:hypothetical protein [Bryobacteraceae bacterium]